MCFSRQIGGYGNLVLLCIRTISQRLIILWHLSKIINSWNSNVRVELQLKCLICHWNRVQEGVQPCVLVFYHTSNPVGRNMIYVKCLHISVSVSHAIWLVGSSINRTFLFLSFSTAFRISLSMVIEIWSERELTFLFSRK